MIIRRFLGLGLGLFCGVLVSATGSTWAQGFDEIEAAVVRGQIRLLERDVAAQGRKQDEVIANLVKENEAQRETIAELHAAIDTLMDQLQTQAPAGGTAKPATRTASAAAPKPTKPQRVAKVESTPEPDKTPPAEDPPLTVGNRPSDEAGRPRIDLFSGVGGILTPKGMFVVEPSVRYATTADNRFFFSGAEIIDALLIGTIQASDTERRSISFNQSLRYGVTGRLDVDVSIPFVSQEDRRRSSDISSSDGNSALSSRSASGIGDVAAGVHYQLNQGRKWPYVIANLRAKSTTGKGPFDIDFDSNGNPLEATTGAGYWSIEPSLTFIKQVDPVALFANIGYQFNLEHDIDRTIGDTDYIRFDPGDTLRTSVGIGIGLNDQINLNFGYDQSYVFESETFVLTTVDGEEVILSPEGDEATVSSFLFGITYRPRPRVSYGLTTTIGATDDAPDAAVTLKGQFRF